MTLDNMVSNLLLRLKHLDATVEVSRPTLKVIVNEALDYAYEFALRTDYTFYVKSDTFSSVTSVAYPSSFRELIYVEITGSTDGQARIASNRQYNTMLLNPYENVGSDSPIVRLNATTFTLSTSSSGTFYYLWSFPYQNTGSTELNTLVPWIYDEVIILKAMEITRVRHNLMPTVAPSELQKQLQAAEDAVKALHRDWAPLNVYRQETPHPV